ncbi:probable serine/threonine-protein kinase mkcB [Bactrocera neohumeralis]|uniref:probable serine/threonine-protein kinase mkcB n=1 Tax=Bactrocera neohumeralis TaxID=98809 RepID=UPI0021669B25|nr:probable serine/threonine-protein kinase mkcB [Bactrocera neohumeralis]
MEDYEYPGALTPSQKQQFEQQLLKRQRLQLQPRPQNRPQQTTTIEQQQQAVQGADPHNRPTTSSNNNNNNPPTENSLLSTLKSLKTMWDIYQAFSAAWNSLATHRQQQEQQQQEAAKRRQQQIAQQTRINSKKPPKIGANDKYTQRNNSSSSAESSEVTGATAPNAAKRVKPNNRATKNPKTTTKTTTTAQSTTSTELVASSEVEETVANSSSNGGNNRNAGSKGDTMARQNAQGNREKRQSTDTAVTESTDVGEGRYIKGDPLKGYYDFVITEGSYKFWAVFQTGTALLIIYSTFAAIYYSKVNPLVSDYDYTDYLGGARSLSGGDDDFIDDDSDGESGGKHGRRSSWLDAMLPRAGRTMKYILDALDKLPVDHREADAAMRGERAGAATTNEQAIGEGDATGNAYENENDDDDDANVATRQSAEEVGSEAAPEELETTQRQVRAYAA